LRWDWSPVFLDPANRVDGVLTGHDHFYARNFRMGFAGEKPQAGVLFLTSAGGGASLYPSKQRDYVAKEKSVHHFTLFDFDGDRATLTPIDIDGNVFDRYELTKEPTPSEQFTAFEVEELRQFLRKALAVAPTQPRGNGLVTTVDTTLEVPTRFRISVSGKLTWEETAGWKLKKMEVPFHLKPNQPLRIPLQAVVSKEGLSRSPRLEIQFDAGQFANRTISLYPFKPAGPREVSTDEEYLLLPTTPDLTNTNAANTEVQFRKNPKNLVVRIRTSRKEGKTGPAEPGSQLILSQDHLRLDVWDGKNLRSFALAPEGLRYADRDKKEDATTVWAARLDRDKDALIATLTIPRSVFQEPDQVRVNVVDHRRIKGATKKASRRTVTWELCPAYRLGIDPDVIPDWNYVAPAKSNESPEKTTRHFASIALR
jgi:hypothetical protein